MVDGKISSTLSQYDSTQKCYICGKTPKKMNTDTTHAANEDMYSFGISPLHSWIRAYECLLHIAYKRDIKTWQARTKEDKESVASRKKHIQERFFAEMVSAPLLSSKSIVQNRKRHALPSETIALLKPPNMRKETSSTEEDE
ncbi:unnamed protein product [Arctia plantaginis]|uniref:Uncharacterized protein n=1 Tax=Arctia plantaginis TaxID=874455 RepID=A0A8S1AM02_ARCPL|nr:unnamed protein product [Arctia plantaginis]